MPKLKMVILEFLDVIFSQEGLIFSFVTSAISVAIFPLVLNCFFRVPLKVFLAVVSMSQIGQIQSLSLGNTVFTLFAWPKNDETMREIVHYDSTPSSSQGIIHRTDRDLIKMRHDLRGLSSLVGSLSNNPSPWRGDLWLILQIQVFY